MQLRETTQQNGGKLGKHTVRVSVEKRERRATTCESFVYPPTVATGRARPRPPAPPAPRVPPAPAYGIIIMKN
ncbi:hypothetical protein EVAR_68699_1 [Eumeta japonica]|uniref:Uncharacterized protein n=1 Tax=Eumeta variegata TaxID=151549 RepID=A0A4C2A4U7_EUMVA|nr:hypothetical protein EVAR_68699_1 [Eumeta japonica]